MNLPFDWPITPWPGNPGANGGFVLTQPLRKAVKMARCGRDRRRDPCRERRGFMGANHGQKLLAERDQGCTVGVSRRNRIQKCLLAAVRRVGASSTHWAVCPAEGIRPLLKAWVG